MPTPPLPLRPRRAGLARRPALRRLLLAAAAPLLAGPLAAQTPTRPPEPADTVLRTPTRGDTNRTADTARATAGRLADPVDRLFAGMPARHLGPGLFGGRVTALAVPRPYRGTMYVGTAGGGVWKTTNRGVTWRGVSDSTGALSVGDVAVAPSDTNVVWLGTGEKNSLRSQGWGNGVWRSTNGGRTWTSAGLADTRTIGRVVVHPRDPNTAWVAALGHLWAPNNARGVYKTTDGGRTWARTLFVNDTTGAVDLVLDPSNPDVVYAATWHRVRWGGTRVQGVGAGSGIHKSTDGGRTWRRLTDPALRNGLPGDRMGRIGLAVSPSRPRTVYAMIQVDRGVVNAAAQPFGGVYRSDDAGATWRHVHDFQAVPHYFYNDVWVDPSNVDHLWVSSTLLMESKDGGRTFAPSRCRTCTSTTTRSGSIPTTRATSCSATTAACTSRSTTDGHGCTTRCRWRRRTRCRSTRAWRPTACAPASRTTAPGASQPDARLARHRRRRLAAGGRR
jgi:photosystem II stability/assembly factor-like uncharacterized protein